MHPPLLDDVGLAAALEAFADGVQRRSGIHVDVDVPPDLGRLSNDLELALFRIVQESITNVHKHAKSDNAKIRILSNTEELSLEIEDSGKGMSAENFASLPTRAGVGIAGMRERMLPFGGVVDVQSGTKGTKVIVTVPINTKLKAVRLGLSS